MNKRKKYLLYSLDLYYDAFPNDIFIHHLLAAIDFDSIAKNDINMRISIKKVAKYLFDQPLHTVSFD